jgi:predicted glycosyltransferase
MFDYEFAIQQHHIGCRLARRVITPDAIPPSRLARFGATGEKLVQYPGLKEEYYLADFEPDPTILDRLGVDTSRVVVVVRPPPDVSLYHRKSNPLFPRVLSYLGDREDVHAVVLPRTAAQRETVLALNLPSVIVTGGAVDAQSLIAASDLVVSAGGSMNREAVALGVPVYTTYGGRLGGVDEALIRSGRLRPLTDARALELEKRTQTLDWPRRDPNVLVDMILSAVPTDEHQR